jgi:hypothetical protein
VHGEWNPFVVEEAMAKKRTLTDELGRSWRIELLPSEPENDDVDEEMVIRYTPTDESMDDVEIRVVGPVAEELPELDRDELALGLEAALNEAGFLFLDRDDHLWWIQTPDEDPTAEGTALTFARFTDELHHPGPLPHPPSELTEDELQELLDQTLGRVIG